MKHHHHFYDTHDQPALLVHDHDYTNVRHVELAIPHGLPIYWDHDEDLDCETIIAALPPGK